MEKSEKKIIISIVIGLILLLSFIFDTNSSKTEESNIFQDPNELITKLSENGIGNLKPWSNPMDIGWGSCTDYYRFGPINNDNGMDNNIAYYVEGIETEVTKMYINLNINNSDDKINALNLLIEMSERTFETLGLKMSDEIKESILNSKEYEYNVGGYTISNKLEKSNIETWKLTFERKTQS